MPGIFISYRSADAQGFAGRLADDLTERFGDALVFRDDELVPGTSYPQAIHDRLLECEALLAVIGPNWWSAATPQGESRLQDPDDWVRREIELALARNAYVVPVLVAGAELPSALALPHGMRTLTHRQCFRLSDDNWHDDVGKLAKLLKQCLPGLRDIGEHRGGTVQEILDRIATRIPRHSDSEHRPRWWSKFFSACLRKVRTLVVLSLLAAFVYFLINEYGDAQTKDFFRRLQHFAGKLISDGIQTLRELVAQYRGE